MKKEDIGILKDGFESIAKAMESLFALVKILEKRVEILENIQIKSK